MSVNSILPLASGITGIQQPSTNSNPTEESHFWQTRMTPSFIGLTTNEVNRLSTRLLGFGAAGVGVSAFYAAILGLVSWPVGLLAFPCMAGAAGAIWYSFQFYDYDNPEELAKFRDDAMRMTLEQVIQTYGWGAVLRWEIITAEQLANKYRQQMRGKNLIEIIDAYEKTSRHIEQCPHRKYEYQVPSPSEWRKQWRIETAAKTFEEIIQIYPFDKLEKYNLLEAGELQRVKKLKSDFDRVKGNYDTQVQQIEREFQVNTESYLRIYQSECAQADQFYNNNQAVRHLQVFEIRYIRERQVVQETATRCKSEARNRFDQGVATITNHGQIPYNQLSAGDKILYDQKNNELQICIVQADNEARVQIANIDLRCIGERSRLNNEELHAREERTRMANEAKQRYDAAVFSHCQYKEQRLVSVNALFGSVVNDLNGSYRAYLRTIGALA